MTLVWNIIIWNALSMSMRSCRRNSQFQKKHKYPMNKKESLSNVWIHSTTRLIDLNSEIFPYFFGNLGRRGVMSFFFKEKFLSYRFIANHVYWWVLLLIRSYIKQCCNIWCWCNSGVAFYIFYQTHLVAYVYTYIGVSIYMSVSISLGYCNCGNYLACQ